MRKAWEDFARLMRIYFDANHGYGSRRAVQRTGFEGDYDHLARFGEWDGTDEVIPVKVGS